MNKCRRGSFLQIPPNRLSDAGIISPLLIFTDGVSGTAMFGFTTSEEAVVQLNVNGPWTVTYINPADDLRKK
jgi:hypothetical protein